MLISHALPHEERVCGPVLLCEVAKPLRYEARVSAGACPYRTKSDFLSVREDAVRLNILRLTLVGFLGLSCGCASRDVGATLGKSGKAIGGFFGGVAEGAVSGFSSSSNQTGRADNALEILEFPAVTADWVPENVAVFDLKGVSLRHDEAKALSGKLTTTIVDSGLVRVITRSEIAAVLEEQDLQSTDFFDNSADAMRVGKMLKVQKIIVGSLVCVGKTYNLSLRMLNVETGAIECTVDGSLRAKTDDLLRLADVVGRQLLAKYHALRTKDANKASPKPASPAADAKP